MSIYYNPNKGAAFLGQHTPPLKDGKWTPEAAAFLNTLATKSNQTPQWIMDTNANRANYNPSNYLSSDVSSGGGNQYIPNNENGLYYETDRNVFYRAELVADVPTWVYFLGMDTATQATLPTDLGVSDAGFLLFVSDYNHVLEWNGADWQWGPGEEGSGLIVLFGVLPSATGWVLCNGSSASYLLPNGTLGTAVLPTTANTFFRQ